MSLAVKSVPQLDPAWTFARLVNTGIPWLETPSANGHLKDSRFNDLAVLMFTVFWLPWEKASDS